MSFDKYNAALEPLRVGLQADGADLKVMSVSHNGARVEVELITDDETCLDCILPRDMLTSMLESRLQDVFSDVKEVHLLDPRESRAS